MKICEDPWECIELVPSSAHSRDQDSTYKLEDELYEDNMQMMWKYNVDFEKAPQTGTNEHFVKLLSMTQQN